MPVRRLVLVLTALIFVLGNGSTHGAPDSLIQAANGAAKEFREEIERLAGWAERNGLADEARQTRALLPPREPDRIYIPTFPLKVGTLDLPRGLPATLPREYAEQFASKEKEEVAARSQNLSRSAGKDLSKRDVWQIRFRTLRQDYAKRLAGMARGAAGRDRGTLAVQMAIAGLQADPDHPVFRNVFGFARYKGEWRTAWETDRLKKGFVDHETFGWIPQKAVARYEKGDRYCNGKWVSIEEETRFRSRNIEDGWKIESEHYDLVTNHSLEEGVRLVRLLEDFYRTWKLVFFRYMASDAQLASLFDGKSVQVPQRRHQFLLYRNRHDYHQALYPGQKKKEEKDGVQYFNGLYRHRGNQGVCLFHAVEPGAPEWQRRSVARIMFHEATHQLFFESRKAVGHYGRDQNYWLVEGVATYMESFHREGENYYVVGGNDDSRVRRARKLKEICSFDDICRLNGSTFKSKTEEWSLYEQVAAKFHFLFNEEDGRWRDAMIVYLRAVYDGTDDLSTLRKLTGCSYNELDSRFGKFLKP